jgi:hypothetical protein
MKHKHTATVLLTLALSITPLYGVMAETDGTATTTHRESFKERLEMKRHNLHDSKEINKDEVRSEMKDKEDMHGEFKAEIAKKHAGDVSRVLAATASRLDKLVFRIESRIQKIKANGGSTSSAEASVALAKTDIATARVHISAIGAFDLSGGSTTAHTNFDQIKTEAKLVKESLKSAHKNLSDAVSSLKGQERLLHLDTDATTTATTTTSHQ